MWLFLWENLYGRIKGNQRPYLIHVFISHGNAAVRPVEIHVDVTWEWLFIRQSVDLYVSPWAYPHRVRFLPILPVWVAHMDGLVELALVVSMSKQIAALGGALITLLHFVSNRIVTHRDRILSQQPPVAEQHELSSGLLNHYKISRKRGGLSHPSH